MDTSTRERTSATQRKFYQWVIKWVSLARTCDDLDESSSQLRPRPDAATLACLLQAIGFKLRSFEKHTDEAGPDTTGRLRIAIECGTSGIRTVLDLDRVECRCPNLEDAKDAAFWSISGTGPTGSVDNMNKIEETGSNLLPRVSKDASKVLRDVSYRLFDIIDGEPDINLNTESGVRAMAFENSLNGAKQPPETSGKAVGIARSHTQPEIRHTVKDGATMEHSRARGDRSCCSVNPSDGGKGDTSSETSPTSKRPVLQRQTTWDIDLTTKNVDEDTRPSPPKITSSPAMVGQLCTSLGQISLQCDDYEPGSMARYMIGAQRNLEMALNMLLARTSPLSSRSSLDRVEGGAQSRSMQKDECSRPIVTVGNTAEKEEEATEGKRGQQPQSRSSFTVTHPRSSLAKVSKIGAIQRPKGRQSASGNYSRVAPNSGIPGVDRRRSFGVPSPASSSNTSLASTGSKSSGPNGIQHSRRTINTTITIPEVSQSRQCPTAKRRVSPEPQAVGPTATQPAARSLQSTSSPRTPATLRLPGAGGARPPINRSATTPQHTKTLSISRIPSAGPVPTKNSFTNK